MMPRRIAYVLSTFPKISETFIIGELAWKSKAGKLGTFVLFFVLAFGMLGFIAKAIIQKLWGI